MSFEVNNNALEIHTFGDDSLPLDTRTQEEEKTQETAQPLFAERKMGWEEAKKLKSIAYYEERQASLTPDLKTETLADAINTLKAEEPTKKEADKAQKAPKEEVKTAPTGNKTEILIETPPTPAVVPTPEPLIEAPKEEVKEETAKVQKSQENSSEGFWSRLTALFGFSSSKKVA